MSRQLVSSWLAGFRFCTKNSAGSWGATQGPVTRADAGGVTGFFLEAQAQTPAASRITAQQRSSLLKRPAAESKERTDNGN